MGLGVHLEPKVLPLLLRAYDGLAFQSCREGFGCGADFAIHDSIFSCFDIRDAPGDEMLADEVDDPADFSNFRHRQRWSVLRLVLCCCVGF